MHHVKLTFTEPLLGTAPMDKEVYSTYIADRRVTDGDGDFPGDEVASIDEDKGKTGFHRVNGAPVLYDYMIKGFCKDACGMLNRVEGSRSKQLRAYKKVIDGLLFIFPRQIPIITDQPIGVLERPLRAQTAQGERVALAASEMIAAGATIDLQIKILSEKQLPIELLCDWLDYGALRGLGQWRNGSYGRFTYELSNR